MGKVIDLDILFPEEKNAVSFKGKDGQVFEIVVDVPNSVALQYLKYHRKGTQDEEESFFLVFTEFLKNKYPDVDIDYVKENIRWEIIYSVNQMIAKDIVESIDKFTQKINGEKTQGQSGDDSKKK